MNKVVSWINRNIGGIIVFNSGAIAGAICLILISLLPSNQQAAAEFRAFMFVWGGINLLVLLILRVIRKGIGDITAKD